MTTRSTAHSTFVIERTLRAAPERVFAAWSRAEKKRRWFSCNDDWKTVDYQLDFQVGGLEINEVVTPAGSVHAYRARYLNIVPEQRIVLVYDMHVAGVHISASLVTITFAGDGDQTRMIFTEQVVIFDGHGDAAERREGTEVGLAQLDAMLRADANTPVVH